MTDSTEKAIAELNAKSGVLVEINKDARIEELEQADLDSWPCQHLHGGVPPFIYYNQTDGLCTHDECHPKNKDLAEE